MVITCYQKISINVAFEYYFFFVFLLPLCHPSLKPPLNTGVSGWWQQMKRWQQMRKTPKNRKKTCDFIGKSALLPPFFCSHHPKSPYSIGILSDWW
jgi:hypothetical protein